VDAGLIIVAMTGLWTETSTAAAASPAPLLPGYALVWQDEFNAKGEGQSPDPGKWDCETGTGAPETPGWGNNELQYYTGNARNVFVENGQLHIRAILADSQRPDRAGPTSGRLISKLGLLPVYGHYEIRAQLPCGRGSWPAIWMLGQRGEWPERGEIDLAEWSGRYDGVDELRSALHAADFHGGGARIGKATVPAACGGFHAYRLWWTASEIRVAVDGGFDDAHLVYRKPEDATAASWPFSQPFRLILNVAVGGDLGGEVEANEAGTFEMLVDYVRVFRAE
jgi:beta-glucanase (GH16 family)